MTLDYNGIMIGIHLQQKMTFHLNHVVSRIRDVSVVEGWMVEHIGCVGLMGLDEHSGCTVWVGWNEIEVGWVVDFG